jgi:hypothetical protein
MLLFEAEEKIFRNHPQAHKTKRLPQQKTGTQTAILQAIKKSEKSHHEYPSSTFDIHSK